MRTRNTVLTALAALTVAACGGGGSKQGPGTSTGGTGGSIVTGDFSVEVVPDTVTLLPGEAGVVVIHVTRTGGFAEAVDVVLSGLPAGASAAPIRVGAGASTGIGSVTAGASASSGTTVTVTASYASVVHRASFGLSIASRLPTGGSNPTLAHLWGLDANGFANPSGVAVDAGTGLVYVVSDQGNGLAILDPTDPSAPKLQVRALASSDKVAVNPVTHVVYATGATANLVIFDGSTVTQKYVGGALNGVAVDAATNQVVVGENLDHTVYQLDASNGYAVQGSWRFSDAADGPVEGPVAVDSVRHLAYASLYGGVGVVDEATGDWSFIPISRTNSTLTQSPAALVTEDAAGTLYILGHDGFTGNDGWIHLADDSIIPSDTSTTTTNAANALAIDPATNKLYVTDSRNQSVNVVDLNTRTFLKQVLIPKSTSGQDEGPIGVAVDPTTHQVYATMRYWDGVPVLAVIDGR